MHLQQKVAHAVASLTKGVVCVDNRLFVLFMPSNNVPADTDIKHNAQKALRWIADIDTTCIEINLKRGGITLKGTVPSFWHMNKAEDLISDLQGVIDVKNVLAVVPTEKIDDEIIAGNVVNELDRSAFLDAGKVLVKVVHGVVTLSGEVNSTYARWRMEMAIENTLGVRDLINRVNVKYV